MTDSFMWYGSQKHYWVRGIGMSIPVFALQVEWTQGVARVSVSVSYRQNGRWRRRIAGMWNLCVAVLCSVLHCRVFSGRLITERCNLSIPEYTYLCFNPNIYLILANTYTQVLDLLQHRVKKRQLDIPNGRAHWYVCVWVHRKVCIAERKRQHCIHTRKPEFWGRYKDSRVCDCVHVSQTHPWCRWQGLPHAQILAHTMLSLLSKPLLVQQQTLSIQVINTQCLSPPPPPSLFHSRTLCLSLSAEERKLQWSVHAYTHTHTHEFTHTHTHTFAHTRPRTHTYTYIYTYVYIYRYLYIYICT